MAPTDSNHHPIIPLSLLIAVLCLAGCGGLPSATQSQKTNPVPDLAAASPALSFGSVPANTSADLTEILTNTGAAAISITAANLTGAGFAVSGLTLPMTLAANQSVTFKVVFTPSSAGSSTASLSVVSTAANSPLNIALSGQAMALGQLVISPSTLAIGNVTVGASGSLNATVQATGSSVTITSASVQSNEFTLSGISLPTTLAAGQSASFSVTFNPASSGSVSSLIGFMSNAANSPTTETVTGTGTASDSGHTVALDWNASSGSDAAIGYNVYRGEVSGGPYSQINSGVETGTTYTDSGVEAGQTYYYVTTAVDDNGIESPYSNEAQAVVPNP